MPSFNARALIASPLVVLLASGTRLLMVSNYNSDTAIILLKTGGIGDTVLGTIIPLLPIVLPLLTIILFSIRKPILAFISGVCSLLVAVASPGFNGFLPAWNETVINARWFLVSVLQIANNSVWSWVSGSARTIYEWIVEPMPHPIDNSLRLSVLKKTPHAHSLAGLWHAQWLMVVIALIVFLTVMWRIDIDPNTGAVSQTKKRFTTSLVEWFLIKTITIMGACVMVVATAYVYFAVAAVYPIPPNDAGLWQESLHRFWEPPETVWLTSGKQEVAYPLGEEDGWQVLLADDTRIIQYIKPDDLIARRVCYLIKPAQGLPLVASQGIKIATPPPCYPTVPARSR